MLRFTSMAVLTVSIILSSTSWAVNPGPAFPGTARATYDLFTGEIIVSINGVNNWYIESASARLIGDDPVFPFLIPGSLPTSTDSIIGETAFAVATGTDVSLGFVADTGLSFGELTINWNAGLGSPVQTDFVSWGPINDPPTAVLNGPILIDTVLDPLNYLILDASGSFDDGLSSPLSFEWDLFNTGTFEFSTGSNPTFEIGEAAAAFGGNGVYPISVRVFDGEFYDTAETTVTIVPEPTTLCLVAFGLFGLLLPDNRRLSA